MRGLRRFAPVSLWEKLCALRETDAWEGPFVGGVRGCVDPAACDSAARCATCLLSDVVFTCFVRRSSPHPLLGCPLVRQRGPCKHAESGVPALASGRRRRRLTQPRLQRGLSWCLPPPDGWQLVPDGCDVLHRAVQAGLHLLRPHRPCSLDLATRCARSLRSRACIMGTSWRQARPRAERVPLTASILLFPEAASPMRAGLGRFRVAGADPAWASARPTHVCGWVMHKQRCVPKGPA